MKQAQTRLSESQMEYLRQIVREGWAENVSEAIRLIVTERMARDSGLEAISPFEYRPAKVPRKVSRNKTVLHVEVIEATDVKPSATVIAEVVAEEEPAPDLSSTSYFDGNISADTSALSDEERAIFEAKFGKRFL